MEHGLTPLSEGKSKTPLRKLVIQSNQASKRNANLVESAQKKLQIPLRGNETINSLQRLCLGKIYEMTPDSQQSFVEPILETILVEKGSFSDILQIHQHHQLTAASHPPADSELGQRCGGSEGGDERDQAGTASKGSQEGGGELPQQLLRDLPLDPVSAACEDLSRAETLVVPTIVLPQP